MRDLRSNVFSYDFFRSLLPLCCIVAEEVFERFIIGQACQDSFAGVLVGGVFPELFSQGFELFQESAVVFCEGVFEFFADMAGIGWAGAVGADSYL